MLALPAQGLPPPAQCCPRLLNAAHCLLNVGPTCSMVAHACSVLPLPAQWLPRLLNTASSILPSYYRTKVKVYESLACERNFAKGIKPNMVAVLDSD